MFKMNEMDKYWLEQSGRVYGLMMKHPIFFWKAVGRELFR
jgi:hypothetical protein